MVRFLFSLLIIASATAFAQGGSVITTNLPANTAIVNISGTEDGVGGYDGTQDKWYQPFSTGGAAALLKYTIQPGTYTFQLTNPSRAATRFPALTSGQLTTIFTAWTYNSPWVTDYMVFDNAAASDNSVSQLFSGAITPPMQLPGFSTPTEAFDNAHTKGFDIEIIDSPGGRYTGTVKTQRTFTTAETLIFGAPDNALGDNAGGVSVVISPVAASSVPGDYNGNGKVDAADYVVWRNGGPLQNEVATIGSISADDYTAWRARFGNTAGSGAGDALVAGDTAQVPEPTALLLLAVGAVATALYAIRARKSI